MTYIWCGADGWCYLFNVIDACSKEWISYVFGPTAVKENAIGAMAEALRKHPEARDEIILRVDNGPQYASNMFRRSAKALGVTLEFIAYRTPEQNGSIESFHGRFKREYVWPQDFNTFQEANTAIADAFIDYNGRRPHSSLGYIPPYEFMMRSIKK
ncbi:MAG: transposase [Nitrososphaerota archaeon]|nr:transposase [Nitrososphaerota archaeon]